jgi:hypothetical protein
LGGVKLGVAAGNLFCQSRRFFLCLIDEVLNGANDPVRERGIGVETRQFSVQIQAGIIPDNRT